MKLLVIGCGQCGGRIADEFSRIDIRARKQRGIDIVADTFAVNTDVTDLSGLYSIKRDSSHRIVIGTERTAGHGVGKVNELGAKIARAESEKILEIIRRTPDLKQTDAFMLSASAAGGTGSGTIAVITEALKNYFPEKPVYNLVVLPFKYEESTEERVIYNSATCLKSSYLIADAVFLVDNQRFVKKSLSLSNNLHKINSMVVEPFYNLLCAGEEKKAEYVGSRVLDAGDIIQTLSGWTAIGYGTVMNPGFRLFGGGDRSGDFRGKATQDYEEFRAMNAALDDLSLEVNPTDAHRALYLLTCPPEKMNLELLGELGTALKNIAKDAVIRSGDYPRRKRSLDVTIVLSELRNVARITDLFTRVIFYLSAKKKLTGPDAEQRQLEDAFKDIPSLL